jgi:hypothetical protein
MHDSTKVLMGQTQSSYKEVDCKAGSIAAGTIVRLKSDGTISLASADGKPLGISLGKDLSNTSHTAICRKGLRVPVLLTSQFTPTIGAQVSISDTTGIAIAAGGGATALNAIYATSTLTGVKEDGTTANVALIDFPGGL